MAQKHENEGARRGEGRTPQQAGSHEPARETGRPREEGTQAPARWDPFRELDLFRDLRLGRPLTSLLDELFGERGLRGGGGGRWMPAVDLDESADAYTLTAELPGAKPEEVELEVRESTLTIRGEKRCEREEKKERGHWMERSYGAFVRSFTLPSDADVDRVEASFRDGVLTVRMPKSDVAKPKRIPIQ